MFKTSVYDDGHVGFLKMELQSIGPSKFELYKNTNKVRIPI